MTIIKRYNPDTSQWEKVNVSKEGAGLLKGGDKHQVLAKESGDDYELNWENPSLEGYSANAFSTLGARIGEDGLELYGLNDRNFAELVSITSTMQVHSVSLRMNMTNVANYRVPFHRSGDLGYFLAYAGVSPRFVWRDGTNTFRDIGYITPALPANAGMRWYRLTIDGTGPDTITNIEVAPDSESEPSSWTLYSTKTAAGITGVRVAGVAQIGVWISVNHAFVGTISRVIERHDNTVVADVDFSQQNLDELLFRESSVNQSLVVIRSTRYTHGIPGAQIRTRGTFTVNANTQWYFPFIVTEKCSIDMLLFSTNTTHSTPSSARCAVYRADSNQQPVGAPLFDSGDISISTATRYSKQLSPTILEPGVYLSSLITANNTVFRCVNGGFGGVDVGRLTTSPYYLGTTVSRTYGAYLNPAPNWNTAVATSVGPAHPVIFRYTAVD